MTLGKQARDEAALFSLLFYRNDRNGQTGMIRKFKVVLVAELDDRRCEY